MDSRGEQWSYSKRGRRSKKPCWAALLASSVHRLNLLLAWTLTYLFLLSTTCTAQNSLEKERILWKEEGSFANLPCKTLAVKHMYVHRLKIRNDTSVIKTTSSLSSYINLAYFDWTLVSKDKLYYSLPRSMQKSLHHSSVKQTNSKCNLCFWYIYQSQIQCVFEFKIYLDSNTLFNIVHLCPLCAFFLTQKCKKPLLRNNVHKRMEHAEK